nr:reverse transcriptase domain-containing protein [Tanacetum cinerariifolium]
MNTASTSGSGTLPGNTIANPKGELKAITTQSGLVTKGPTVPNPPKPINPEEDECVTETYTDPDHAEYNIKVPPPPTASLECLFVIPRIFLDDHFVNFEMTLELANRAICTPDGIARDVFVPIGKFTFPADFVVVDYESDPRVPFILGRPFLRTSRTLIGVHDEEMILRDGDERLTLNMKHDTASYSNHPYRESVNLINIFNLSAEDCLKDLVSHKQSGNPTFLLQKEIASPKVIHEFYDSEGCNFLSEEFPDIDSFNDIHPHFDDDPLSGSTTYSANSLLEEFADELALISYPPDYDDYRACDIESDIREIEFFYSKDFSKDDVLFSPNNEDKVRLGLVVVVYRRDGDEKPLVLKGKKSKNGDGSGPLKKGKKVAHKGGININEGQHMTTSHENYSDNIKMLLRRFYMKKKGGKRWNVNETKGYTKTGLALMINRRNRVKDVQTSAYWVWKSFKPNNASIILKIYDYVDVRGRSRGNSSTRQWEYFFTSSGKIALAVGTILHYQWELLLAVGTHHWKWENCTRSGNGSDI